MFTRTRLGKTTMKKSVEDNLIDFFRLHSREEFASGALEKIGFTGKNGKVATGSTVSRKLRGLAMDKEDGTKPPLKVTYQGPTSHAHYSLNTEVVKPKMRQIKTDLPDGSARLEYVPY